MVRMTLEQVVASTDVDRAKVDATTDEEVRRYMVEDGEDPDAPAGPHRIVHPPAEIRKRTGLSQDAFAKAIGVPAGTIRNWEQGRKLPDPAARSLLALVATDHQMTLDDLQTNKPEPQIEELATLTHDDLKFLQDMLVVRRPVALPTQNDAARLRGIEKKLRAARLDAILTKQR